MTTDRTRGMQFRKAAREQAWLRLALVGPSGSGKTFTALTLATALADRVAVIDTERGSASKYAGEVASFDVLELEAFSPEIYLQAVRAAAAEGFPALVIDSLSHAWIGREGALEQADKVAARSRKSAAAAWRRVTPMHDALVDAILSYPGHVLVTMRARTEWVLEQDERGKKTSRKIGLEPLQREGVEYEFDVVGDLDHEHRLSITKSRCPALADTVIRNPGSDVAETLRAWLAPAEKRIAKSA